jgi:hypothetical protein
MPGAGPHNGHRLILFGNEGYGRMLAQHYRSFKQDLDEKGIIFSFSGYISEGILYSLGEALRQKMTLEDANLTTVKKVFSVFVEQAQNIIRYSADKLEGQHGERIELSSGMVSIGNDDGDFFIVCGNVILEKDMERLKERLEHLNSLDRPAIKAFYREQLRETPDEDSRGATIGLIEIARRASRPIEFGFDPVESGKTFFCMRVSI